MHQAAWLVWHRIRALANRSQVREQARLVELLTFKSTCCLLRSINLPVQKLLAVPGADTAPNCVSSCLKDACNNAAFQYVAAHPASNAPGVLASEIRPSNSHHHQCRQGGVHACPVVHYDRGQGRVVAKGPRRSGQEGVITSLQLMLAQSIAFTSSNNAEAVAPGTSSCVM